MKKFIIYILCFTLFLQNGFVSTASEVSSNMANTQEEMQQENEKLVFEDVIQSENVDKSEEPIKEKNEEDSENAPLLFNESNPLEKNEEVYFKENSKVVGDIIVTEEEKQIEDDFAFKNIDSQYCENEELVIEKTIENVTNDETQKKDRQILKEEQEIFNDDPQYGRENGYLDMGFGATQLYSGEQESYIHNEKYRDYIIKEVIDVSQHQGDIDWGMVKESGIDYAMIRAGFRGYGKTASLNVDQKFVQNIEAAISAGIEVGIYFFSQAVTVEEANEEAEYVLGLIEGYNISLPVAIDFEYASTAEGLVGRLYDAKLSKEDATKICKQFCKKIEEKHYKAMVYANKNMLENSLNASELLQEYSIWLANYTTSTSYEGEYEFWQYTSSGSVEGITKNVDKSFWYIAPDLKYAEIEEGIYTISTCLNAGKVISILNESVANNIGLQLKENDGSWAQKFYIRQETTDTYVIMSANSGKVLEVKGGSLYQNTYTGTTAQQWRFRLNDDDSYIIEPASASTDMVLDVQSGKAFDGTKIQIYKANGSKAQKFWLNAENESKIRTIEDGIYYIETLLSEDKVINLRSDGTNVEIQLIDGSKPQKIQLEYVDNGCYHLISSSNQKLLTSGDNYKVFFSNNTKDEIDQRWILKEITTDVYTIISAKDGKNLDVASGKKENGTAIQKYMCNGLKAQQFKFYEAKIEESILEDGVYVIHSALNDTSVVDLSSGSKKADANIQLYKANGSVAQMFILKRLEDGYYSIYSYHSGMAVAVKDGKNVDGTNVLQVYPVGGKAQKWDIISKGKGYYSIVSAVGGKVLDVAGGKSANGTNIQVYTANGLRAQKFRFEKVADLNELQMSGKELLNGTYTIASTINENYVLDISGGSIYAGANVQLYTQNGLSPQQFVIKRDSNTGLYTILSKRSGMCINYKNGDLKNSTNVCQSSPQDEAGSLWRIKHVVGDYYMLYAGNSDFCLDVAGGKAAKGTNIHIYKENGYKAQIFKFNLISNQTITEQNASIQFTEGIYTISSALNDSMVLDVASGSQANGANIQLYKSNNSNAQKYIVYQLSNGNYTLMALHSKKLLTVADSNVCQQSDTGALNHQWKILSVGNGYYTLKSAYNGKVIDVAGGKQANGTNIQVYISQSNVAQRFKFTPTTTKPEIKFVSNGSNSYSLSYKVYTKGNESSADNKYYLMLADSYAGKIYGSPLASIEKNFDVSISLSISDRAKLKEIAMNKLVLAVKQSDGSYKSINTPIAISNPEAIAKNTSAIFKASSKKGVQGVTYASSSNDPHPKDARYTNTKQTLLNLDIAEVVNPESDYTTFTYKGKTYKFSKCSALVADIKSLNAGYKQYMYGNSGTTKVAVSLCLLLSYDSENKFLIDPAARSVGHAYYLLNVREDTARETLEALFVYLGELFGQNDCYVTNWILGNEINSSKAWNYSGSLNFDTYMNCYTTAFRMLYNAVKSEKTGNTVSISLDNGWTAAPDTYAGKTTLDSFAKKINAENPNIEWSIAYHPYSYPLTRVDFWNDSSNTTNSTSTKYISMKNISVLTDYVATLEKTYKMDTGSIRVLLTEQGYSYSGGADTQATAIARGYYIAEFNDRIDTFIIRALVDDAEEAKGKLYLGIMNGFTDKRTSFFVYEFMDSDLSKLKSISASSVVTEVNYGRFNSAKNILCNTNWKLYVPGFNAAKLAGIK